MKKLRVAGLALLATLAFGSIAIASASALSSVWLVNGSTIGSKVLVLSEATLLFEDMGLVPAGFTCALVANEGWVGPGSEDEVTSVTFNTSNCFLDPKAENLKDEVVSNDCTSIDGVAMLGLPWKTLVVLSGGVFLDQITGTAAPGYLVECVSVLGLVDDACTTQKGSTELKNNSSNGVTAVFPQKPESESEFANCSIGGNLNGLVVGESLLFTASGLSLTVSEG
jgi:hypothetical protein